MRAPPAHRVGYPFWCGEFPILGALLSIEKVGLARCGHRFSAVWASSFARIAETWWSTVLLEMKRRSAMSAFVQPSPINDKTSN